MANPTTNFGWVMPTATSLVTNLPADFNTFGQAVDTSLQYLLGGTTGQVLSKTSGTNMAFTWVTPQVGDITAVTAGTGISGGGTTGDVTITNSMATALTTKGDLTPATGSAAFARLGVGANNTVLTADSTAATGLKWASIAASGASYSLINGGGTALSGATSVTISSISGMNSLYLRIEGAVGAASADLQMRLNADSGANYQANGNYLSAAAAWSSGNMQADTFNAVTQYPLGRQGSTTSSTFYGGGWINGANSTGIKFISSTAAWTQGGGSNQRNQIMVGHYSGTSVISSLTILTTGTAFTGGTVYVYGSAN